MRLHVSRDAVADQVWRAMSALVLDNKDAWRRAAVESTGLPFSRIRIVKRLSRGPMTVKEVAEMATIDAPAATVAVNDLEERGLVIREINPANRRCKMVSLTEAGHDLVDALNALADPPPAALAGLEDADLETLRAILDKIPH